METTLSQKTLLSISKKYFTIPDRFISYYPKPPAGAEEMNQSNDADEENLTVKQLRNKRKRHKGADSQDRQLKLLTSSSKRILSPS
jgi:hypothetical protein